MDDVLPAEFFGGRFVVMISIDEIMSANIDVRLRSPGMRYKSESMVMDE